MSDYLYTKGNPTKANPNIRLHPEHGLNVTFVRYYCVVTGKEWESGELAFLGWNKGKEAERYTTMGYRVCPEVQEKLDEGYIAAIVVDAEKTDDVKNPYRTGEIMYIKERAWREIFDDDVPAEKVTFIDTDVRDGLKDEAEEI